MVYIFSPFFWKVRPVSNFLSYNLINVYLILQIYASEESNWHSGTFVFILGQLLSSIPFLFLISISSSLVFYFLVGLRDEFSLLMYFVLNFFICLLVNEGLMLVITALWQDVFWSILTLVCLHVSYTSYKTIYLLQFRRILCEPNSCFTVCNWLLDLVPF